MFHEPPWNYSRSSMVSKYWINVVVSCPRMYPEDRNCSRILKRVFLVERRTFVDPSSHVRTMFQPGCQRGHRPLLHDKGKQLTGRNTSETEREKQLGNHCKAVAKSVGQSPNHCATTLKSECRIGLCALSVRI